MFYFKSEYYWNKKKIFTDKTPPFDHNFVWIGTNESGLNYINSNIYDFFLIP
mgnify:CR=1 FL=1